MNIKRIIFITFISIFALSSPAENLKDYKLSVNDFSQLKLIDHLNVEYFCSPDSAGQIYFSCSPDIASQILFTSNKSCLTIEVADSFNYNDTLPVVKVYSSLLEKVENASDSTIRIFSNDSVQSFKARVIGNGTIVIDRLRSTSADLGLMTGKGQIVVADGSAVKAKFSNIGTGTIQAGNMKVSQAKVILSGTGSVDCRVTDNLSIYGMGSGKVYYSGNPQKVLNRSVGIKAFPVER